MKEKSHIRTGKLKSLSKITLKQLLIAALILHLTIAAATYLTGRLRLLPDTFDSNGIGTSFAIDSSVYREEIVQLVETLFQHGPIAWLAAPGTLHVKLYSLCFAIFHPLFGYTTLSAEPLNAVYYLLILILVFALGREIFDRSTGMLAAAIVAVWPSFLLHTTQLLRDPLFIALMLALVLLCSIWLKRIFPPLKGLGLGLAGAGIVCAIWLLRSQMWEIVQAIALFTAALLIVRQIRERRWLTGNILGFVVLLVITAGVPRVAEKFKIYSFPIDEDAKVARTTEDDTSLQSSAATSPAGKDVEPPLPPGAGLQARITRIRHRSAKKYPDAGSNIDTDVAFNSKADIVRYLPRAAVIGFFSPFPNMWFVAGAQVGLKGRVLCGLETAVMYPLEILAVLGLWFRRRQLTAWLLALIVAAGLTALGMVIVNIAVLYRMRYVFWILMILLSIEGARQIFPRLFSRKAPEAA
jgi:4-amino-4-deoxy-L-arabinose transferase-like glycosyltransferase